jgi:hypothetical protein
MTKIELIENLNEKLGWAERCFQLIKSNRSNENIVNDNFWGFLTAVQQSWYYLNRFNDDLNQGMSKRKKSNFSKQEIENWKNTKLTTEEKDSWNLINKLRNQDTHEAPVKPNYRIVRRVFRTKGGKIFVNGNGKILVSTGKYIEVIFENKIYNIDVIGETGITAIKKLIEYIRKNKT